MSLMCIAHGVICRPGVRLVQQQMCRLRIAVERVPVGFLDADGRPGGFCQLVLVATCRLCEANSGCDVRQGRGLLCPPETRPGQRSLVIAFVRPFHCSGCPDASSWPVAAVLEQPGSRFGIPRTESNNFHSLIIATNRA